MKRLLAVFAAGALGVVGLAAGLAASGFAGNAREVGTDDKITICHVAGLASDPANYITLTLPYNAVYGKNGESGHFNENGTTKAGHEQDTLGPCSPPQTDLCPNLEGVQSEVPEGYTRNENGRCVPTSPQTDLCLNLEGVQSEVPEGYTRNENERCVPTLPPSDLCLNLEGVQSEVPDGYTRNENGRCVPTSPQTDLCPNLEGVQSEVPGGMVLEDGKCAVPPPRLCPDGKPPTSGEDAYDPNDDCKRPPAPVTETTLTTTTESAPTTTPATPTTPSTPAAPFTPPTTKPVAKKSAVKKPAAKPSPATPAKAVAGALANEPPRLAYTP